jgi:cold-inducible RNA-binding protein
METKLYVGNLSYDVTKTDLQDVFAQHGAIQDIHVVTDKVTGKARGFAFVTMETKESAEAAIQALNGSDWNGRAMTVNEARPREERPAFGGGGGGGGRGARRY